MGDNRWSLADRSTACSARSKVGDEFTLTPNRLALRFSFSWQWRAGFRGQLGNIGPDRCFEVQALQFNSDLGGPETYSSVFTSRVLKLSP
jgi:hypothetical protein